MYLVFRKDKNIILSIDLNEYEFDDLIFGRDSVKELLFIKTIKENSDFGSLKPLYDLLYNNYKDADETLLVYSDNLYNVIHFPIKNILYRDMHYMHERTMEVQEYLSIRFIEDNMIEYNNEKENFECSRQCSYYDFSFCNKYNEEIINKEICEQCKLEMEPIFYKYI